LHGTRNAPDFSDAVRMHKLIDQINLSSKTGETLVVNWN
jgi:hypothetical protein